SLQELKMDDLNATEHRAGLRATKFVSGPLSSEERAQGQLFRTLVQGERRDVEGAPMLAHLGTYSGLGYFVPTEFFKGVFNSLKAYDFLFDPDFVTFIKTANGRQPYIRWCCIDLSNAPRLSGAGLTMCEFFPHPSLL